MTPRAVVKLEDGRIVGVLTNVYGLEVKYHDDYPAVDTLIEDGPDADVEVTYDPDAVEEQFDA